MNRIIPCIVSNEYVKGDGVAVGAAGSHNDVVLELHFTDFWEGLAKSITWLDANGENPTITMLTTDMLKPGESDAYLVPIPAEPKRVAGTMTMSIKGAAVSGESETRASLTTTAHFKVLESVYDEDAAEAGDITATQAEQMQGQLESILNDIVRAGQAADAKEAAEASAAAAEASAEAAVTQANAAAQSASSALFSEQQAQTFANAAQTAQSAAEAAQEASETAEFNANQYARDAKDYRDAAQESVSGAAAEHAAAVEAAREAQGSEDEARQYALDASASANMAATNAASAGAAATAASGSASAAAGSAAQAQQYAEQAGQIVGGDFATKTELSTGLAGKADLVGGKVPASQLPAMDYDASGSASAALTAANAYTDAQITAIPTPDVSGQIAAHNSDTSAHQDIRNAIPDVSGKLDKSGGAMTGALTLSGDPTENMQAATKQYVDAHIVDAYTKEETLTAATAAKFGLTTRAVPNDVFEKIAGNVRFVWKERNTNAWDDSMEIVIQVSKANNTVYLYNNIGNTNRVHFTYGDNVINQDGTLQLDPQTAQEFSKVLKDTGPEEIWMLTRGKYVCLDGTSGSVRGILYVSENAPYSAFTLRSQSGSYFFTISQEYVTWLAARGDMAITYDEWARAYSDDRNTYPDNGIYHGTEYEYLREEVVDKRIEYGSYQGTGTYGAEAPSTLTFAFEPRVLFIFRESTTAIISNFGGEAITTASSSPVKALSASLSNTTLSWWSTASAANQMNASGYTYYYFAIG